MIYTASSVKDAIEDSDLYAKDLEFLKCPVVGYILEDGQLCGGNPQSCSVAERHKCKRKITIYKNKNVNVAPFAVLTFYFTISQTNNDGFILQNDSILRRLIDGGYLSETKMLAA